MEMTEMTQKHYESEISRRAAMQAIAVGAAGIASVAGQVRPAAAQAGDLKGNLKQSVCRWCYQKMDLEVLCENAAEMGLQSVELLDVSEVEVPKRYGLTCAMLNGPTGIVRGWNRVEDHAENIAKTKTIIEQAAEAGMKNVIVFSGNHQPGQSPEQGMDACAQGLSEVMPTAERHGVNVVMELLNSKVDHKNYQCDNTPWGVALAQKIGHPNFKLLYDIYHMQIMEGDVIRTIRENHAFIGHYHTGGVPGRAEIDDSQELNYPAICRAIVETGYDGFLGQEFIPKRDPMTSLAEAVRLCDV
jgi:hydroxypyruvate isomerase